jgi:hypothetical protein
MIEGLMTNSKSLDVLQNTPNSVDLIEHLQAISHLSDDDWLDLLQVSWKDYYSFRSGQKKMTQKSLEALSQFFQIPTESILKGQIDFRSLSLAKDAQTYLPEPYMIGAHGRWRTTLTSIEFLEKRFGWRLRQDVLNKFKLKEGHLTDAFGPISIRLITEICEFLRKRQFSDADFFQMGLYSYQGNRNSLISKLYSEMVLEEAFESLFSNIMPLFEQNCVYTFEWIGENKGLVKSKSNKDVAAALGVKALGSQDICQLKSGIWASTALYFNVNSPPEITHPKCEHRGDESCHYIIDFSNCSSQSQSSSAGFEKACDICN